jgi:hypothetical protein
MTPGRGQGAITLGVALGLLGLLGAGCKARPDAAVGDTRLVQADGVFEPPPGATLEVTPDNVAALTMPAEAVVRLGVGREVRWADVEALIGTIEGHGKRAVMLVGQRFETRAIELRDEVRGDAIEILTFVDGKACVRGPGIKAAKCVQSQDKSYVEKAFVRQLVREAHDGWGLEKVTVEVPLSLHWGDVVNAVDGARTCCGSDVKMRVTTRTSVDDGTMMVPVEE